MKKTREQSRMMVRQTRFERATTAFGGLYSIHLSYWRVRTLKIKQAKQTKEARILPQIDAELSRNS
jgi:hypothetical protein